MSMALAPPPVLAHDTGGSPTRPRRQFTAAYKRQILEAAAPCTQAGQLSALLRRDGLYSSHLAACRAAARRGELAALSQRRGPKATPPDPRMKPIAALERQLARVTARAERAEAIVELHKKVSQLLGLALPPRDALTETR